MGRVKSSDGRAPKFAATLPLLLTPLLTPLPAFTEAAAAAAAASACRW